MKKDDAHDSTGIIPGTGKELGKQWYRLNQYPLDARSKARKLPRKGNSKLNFLLTLPSLVGSISKEEQIQLEKKVNHFL